MIGATVLTRVLAAMHLPRLEFVTPWVLWLLLAIPLWWLLRVVRRRPVIAFSRTDLVARGPKARGVYPRLLFVLRTLALLAFIIAAARPRVPTALKTETREGINIALVVDLSSSMLAQDFQPHNRLDVAKDNLRRFILGRMSDRIGLVVFASEAVTQVPLTTDYPTLLQAVDHLTVGQLDDGTAIGDAIATATNRLRNAPGKSRVMILLTDGVNNRGAIDPLTAAAVARTRGIKIHTIGVGSKGMAPVPVDSGPQGIKVEMQPVEIDEPMMMRIAAQSGGEYFHARDGAALRRIYEQIDRMERTPVTTTSTVRYVELYRWPLAAALILLMLELAVGSVKGPLP